MATKSDATKKQPATKAAKKVTAAKKSAVKAKKGNVKVDQLPPIIVRGGSVTVTIDGNQLPRDSTVPHPHGRHHNPTKNITQIVIKSNGGTVLATIPFIPPMRIIEIHTT